MQVSDQSCWLAEAGKILLLLQKECQTDMSSQSGQNQGSHFWLQSQMSNLHIQWQ